MWHFDSCFAFRIVPVSLPRRARDCHDDGARVTERVDVPEVDTLGVLVDRGNTDLHTNKKFTGLAKIL